MAELEKEPTQAWVTTLAGTAINLCLGILYAWSMWGKELVNVEKAGKAMTGINDGWLYLSNAQASVPFSVCVIMFAVFMIPGGRIQDRISPKFGAILGGLFLAAGCLLSGYMKSYAGLIIGFGVLGGIGMGIGYAAPTPAALKWFGPHRRGVISGLVVSGYGGAALYIGPLSNYLIKNYGLSGSFYILGIAFAIVVIIAGQMLVNPPQGYVPPAPKVAPTPKQAAGATSHNWEGSEIIKTWQFYALVFMFIITTQSGLLVINNAAGLLKSAGFPPEKAWILVAFGGIVNAVGRVATGWYSDIIGRLNAYMLNCILSAICLFLLPTMITNKLIFLLFVTVGVAYWQYGGGLSLMPSFAGDFYGAKNLGFNYGLIFVGWGLGAFMPRLGGMIKDKTGNLDLAFYISGVLLILGVALAYFTKRPSYADFSGKSEA